MSKNLISSVSPSLSVKSSEATENQPGAPRNSKKSLRALQCATIKFREQTVTKSFRMCNEHYQFIAVADKLDFMNLAAPSQASIIRHAEQA